MKLTLKQSLTLETFSFTLILKGEETDDIMADAIYMSCSDSFLCSSEYIITLHFDRESINLEAAINSAVLDVYSAGYGVEAIEID